MPCGKMKNEIEYPELKEQSEKDTSEAREEFKKIKLKISPSLFNLEPFTNFDLKKTGYHTDAIQDELLQKYLQKDARFRGAFSHNLTYKLLEYIHNKTKLHEPINISVLGNNQSGMSYSSITIASFIMALYGKKFTGEYICSNVFEFLDKVSKMQSKELQNTVFLVDNQKEAISIEEVARKIKSPITEEIIQDYNISTIMLNSTIWANSMADYGLRTIGRDFKTKTCRLMLYNLQERGSGGVLPMSMIYLPIFTEVLPYGKELEKKYLEIKNRWSITEQDKEKDVLLNLKKDTAEKFCKDPNYDKIGKRQERITYLSYKLGSAWSKTEIEEMETIIKLMKEGILE
jgi:hypothetical protein